MAANLDEISVKISVSGSESLQDAIDRTTQLYRMIGSTEGSIKDVLMTLDKLKSAGDNVPADVEQAVKGYTARYKAFITEATMDLASLSARTTMALGNMRVDVENFMEAVDKALKTVGDSGDMAKLDEVKGKAGEVASYLERIASMQGSIGDIGSIGANVEQIRSVVTELRGTMPKMLQKPVVPQYPFEKPWSEKTMTPEEMQAGADEYLKYRRDIHKYRQDYKSYTTSKEQYDAFGTMAQIIEKIQAVREGINEKINIVPQAVFNQIGPPILHHFDDLSGLVTKQLEGMKQSIQNLAEGLPGATLPAAEPAPASMLSALPSVGSSAIPRDDSMITGKLDAIYNKVEECCQKEEDSFVGKKGLYEMLAGIASRQRPVFGLRTVANRARGVMMSGDPLGFEVFSAQLDKLPKQLRQVIKDELGVPGNAPTSPTTLGSPEPGDIGKLNPSSAIGQIKTGRSKGGRKSRKVGGGS